MSKYIKLKHLGLKLTVVNSEPVATKAFLTEEEKEKFYRTAYSYMGTPRSPRSFGDAIGAQAQMYNSSFASHYNALLAQRQEVYNHFRQQYGQYTASESFARAYEARRRSVNANGDLFATH